MDGNPVSNVEISIKSVEANQQTLLTDESGKATIRPTRRTVILAKHTVDQAGEYQGQPYSEQRFYCTLVLDAASADTQTAPTVTQTKQDEVSLSKLDSPIPPIPAGLTSFGASRIGQRIYLVGGKSGKAHDYARDYQNRKVFQFDLEDADAGWQPVADNLGLQGLASVDHQSKLIRLGGLEARNKPGEDHDLHSISDVVAFDINQHQWSKLPSLPAGRSSFDACRLGDQIFVVGGWSMAGEAHPIWATDLLMIDLKADTPEWIAVKAPFEKRALAVGSFKNQIVVVGGIDRNGSPSKSVHLFDPQRRTWSQGPALPTEGKMQGFGCAVANVGDYLLANAYDGSILALSPDLKSWQLLGRLDQGRFFHRLVALSDSKFAIVGGANMESGACQEVEVFALKQ